MSSSSPEKARPGDLVETTEDLSAAPLWNRDIAPTRLEERTWNRWNIAALWVGMAVCIPVYMMASGLVSQGMNWWQALVTILLGNMIVLVPMVLNAHAGTRYGIPFPVLARSSFGLYGSNVPALMRAMVACGWFGIQTWIGGSAVYTLHAVMTPGLVAWLDGFQSLLGVQMGPDSFLGLTTGQFTAFVAFWLVNMVFVWIGTESIRWLETLAAPFLLAVGLLLLGWAWTKAGGLGPMLRKPSSFATTGEFLRFFVPALTGMVGFWATLSLNISDFTRFATSQRDQVVGQAIGLPPTMVLFAFIGVAVTSATVVIFGTSIDDPVALLARFDSPLVVCLSLFALTVATISTNIAANIVSPANDFSNLAPRHVSFRIGGTIAGVIGILIMPWKLIANPEIYIFDWLVGYSGLLGPVAAIMICDYWLVRRQELDIPALYRPGGAFPAVNWRAMAALAGGILLNVPGFVGQISRGAIAIPAPLKWTFSYAWFSGFALSFALYWLLMRGSTAARTRS